MLDWTQIILALISTAGTVASVFFSTRAKQHAAQAFKSADEAKAASLRPPRED